MHGYDPRGYIHVNPWLRGAAAAAATAADTRPTTDTVAPPRPPFHPPAKARDASWPFDYGRRWWCRRGTPTGDKEEDGALRRKAADKAACTGTPASCGRDEDRQDGDGLDRRPWGGRQQSLVAVAASRRAPATAAARRGISSVGGGCGKQGIGGRRRQRQRVRRRDTDATGPNVAASRPTTDAVARLRPPTHPPAKAGHASRPFGYRRRWWCRRKKPTGDEEEGGAPRRAAADKAAGRDTPASGGRGNDGRDGDEVERQLWVGRRQSVVGVAASRRAPARAAATRGMTTA